MRVLVNALPLRYGGGISYLQQQMAALARIDPGVEYHTLISPWTEVGDLPGTVETVPVRSVPGRFAYEQLCLPFRKADVFYCPANFSPLVSRVPTVLTLQNANYYRSGLALPETARSRPKWKVLANHLAMRRADAIVAISQSLADDAIATIPQVANRVSVIHSGAPTWPAQSNPISGLPQKFVVTVTSAAPHKRTEDVVDGWARWHCADRLALPLVVVGGLSESQKALHRGLARNCEGALIHLGWEADRARLKWIYQNASAAISMSLLEAFPLTPVEAGSVSCPLVLSDIPSHREVTKNRAAYVPPRDVDALARTLANTCAKKSEEALWEPLATWDDNAVATRKLFDQVLK